MPVKEKYIAEFEKALNEFVRELKNYVSTETGEWTVKGFIDVSVWIKLFRRINSKNIFPKFDSDINSFYLAKATAFPF